MYAIECRALKKTYPGKPAVDAVRGIDLCIKRGECFGLLGPNGAGKTTTIEILEGLLQPSGGDVRVLGRSWQEQPDEIRQRIGISLQETRLLEKLSVRETVRLFRSMYRQGITPEQATEQVSLTGKANAWVSKLSGGQKQRLAVACAIVGAPELLFLDEPTTGLDPAARRELWNVVRGFRDAGRTVLITTHYMDEAERLCDRIAIVNAGKIIAEGTPRELIASLGGDQVIHASMEASPASLHLLQPALLGAPSVTDVMVDNDNLAINVKELHLALPVITQILSDSAFTVKTLTTRAATLDDVFLNWLAGILGMESFGIELNHES